MVYQSQIVEPIIFAIHTFNKVDSSYPFLKADEIKHLQQVSIHLPESECILPRQPRCRVCFEMHDEKWLLPAPGFQYDLPSVAD